MKFACHHQSRLFVIYLHLLVQVQVRDNITPVHQDGTSSKEAFGFGELNKMVVRWLLFQWLHLVVDTWLKVIRELLILLDFGYNIIYHLALVEVNEPINIIGIFINKS